MSQYTLKEPLDLDFLRSIVWVKQIDLSLNQLKLIVLCIEDNKDIYYELLLINVISVLFRQENPKEEFDVIDTILEPLNDCKYLNDLHSMSKEHLWVLRFHSGLHHLVVGFEHAEKKRVEN